MIIKSKRAVFLIFLFVSYSLKADFPNGKEMLEEESRRADELNELEHQVKVIEQKSKIAKAQKEIQEAEKNKESILLDKKNPFDQLMSETMSVNKSVKDDGKDGAETFEVQNNLPVLISIEGKSTAGFKAKNGKIIAKRGDILPGRFKVEQVSIDEGVIVSKSGKNYVLEVNWNAN